MQATTRFPFAPSISHLLSLIRFALFCGRLAALHGVTHVIELRDAFQVGQSIIRFVAVLMIYDFPIWNRAVKRLPYEPMS